jgi:MFS family permease
VATGSGSKVPFSVGAPYSSRRFGTWMRPMRIDLGYAAFALTMTVGRLSGGRIVQRFGNSNIIAFGGICAATGFAMVTLVPAWPVALLGYALVGVGCSNVVPVLFTSGSRQTAMPGNIDVPAITTLGYAGILLGPALPSAAASPTRINMLLPLAAAPGGTRADRACRDVQVR